MASPTDRRTDAPGGRRRFLSGMLAVAAVPTAALGPAALPARAATPSSAGEEVLAVAERQLGVPYSWGGGDRLGPSPGFCSDDNGYLNNVCSGEDTVGFDCSGLTLYCWYQGTAGAVGLAHYTGAQFHKGTPVARNDLMPGDLLFFSRPGAPLHHVGLYAGGSAMIHAERTGTRVARLDDVFHNPTLGPQYSGAVRPGPTG